MKWLTDRKFIALICLGFPFLLCMVSAQAQTFVDDTCRSENLNSIVAQADIDAQYSPAATPVVGTIEYVVGQAVILRGDHKRGYKARRGDAVHQGDTLITLAESTLRLKFENKDIAILGACTNLHIYQYLDDKRNYKKTASLKSTAGNLVFYVLRLFGYRDIQFEVQTPSRVASVRGTKFGISVKGAQGNHLNWLLENDPLQVEGITDCFCDSGSVEIDRKIVHGGTIYKGDTRCVFLLTVNDTIAFQKQFKHPLTPYIMNSISPPGDKQHDDSDARDKRGLEDAEDDHNLEKRARKSNHESDSNRGDDIEDGGSDDEIDLEDDDGAGGDDDVGGGDNDQGGDDNDQGRGDNDQGGDNNDRGDDGNDQGGDNNDRGDDGNDQGGDNNDQGDDNNDQGDNNND